MIKGVYKGRPVAIKMIKCSARNNVEYLRCLLGELKVMSYLGHHANLVELVGAITAYIKLGEVYIVTEFCSNGNVQNFLRTHRDAFVDLTTGLADVFSSESQARNGR